MSTALTVESSAIHFVGQLENTVPVLPFRGRIHEKDSELLKLSAYLTYLGADSCPPHLHMQNFKVELIRDAKNTEHAFELLTRIEHNDETKSIRFS